jgi:hypothetical protein
MDRRRRWRDAGHGERGHRTLAYGLLTVLLGLGYGGLVLVGGQVFGGVAGEPPSWAVAAATLAVATGFQPARRRGQDLVDRRFNRRRYDAARTIEAFSARLRQQVDLDTLTAYLLAVVDRTVQPARSTLWLRPPDPSCSDRGRRIPSTELRVRLPIAPPDSVESAGLLCWPEPVHG